MTTTYDSEWIPVMLADKSTQATLSTEKNKEENNWKPSEPLYDYAEATDRVTKTVTADQFERKNGTTQYNIFEQDLLPDVKDTTKASVQDNDLKDKEGNDNYYDVTESTDEEERNERNSRGYVYKKPVVEPVGLTTARNEFSKRLQDNLKQYNIKSNDMLNNYAISKNYVNNYD
ncbi:hypothetical protein MSG28_007837, partial [Choristoneura fumiferana]